MEQDAKLKLDLVDVSSCEKKLVVEIPADEVDREVEKLALDYSKRAKVPGFRPGKVPLGIIKQRYGSELHKDASHDIIQRTWKKALETHDLHPLAEPSVTELNDKPGEPLKFTVSFEILPKLELNEYKGVSVTATSPSVQDSDVEKALDSLRDQHAQFVPYESGEITLNSG